MFHRKSEAEISQIKIIIEKSKWSLNGPLLISTIIGTFVFFIYSFVGDYYRKAYGPSLDILYISALVAGVIFLYVYWKQFRMGHGLFYREIGVCNKCRKSNHSDVKKCDCGGDFEPSEYYYYDETET